MPLRHEPADAATRQMMLSLMLMPLMPHAVYFITLPDASYGCWCHFTPLRCHYLLPPIIGPHAAAIRRCHAAMRRCCYDIIILPRAAHDQMMPMLPHHRSDAFAPYADDAIRLKRMLLKICRCRWCQQQLSRQLIRHFHIHIDAAYWCRCHFHIDAADYYFPRCCRRTLMPLIRHWCPFRGRAYAFHYCRWCRHAFMLTAMLIRYYATPFSMPPCRHYAACWLLPLLRWCCDYWCWCRRHTPPPMFTPWCWCLAAMLPWCHAAADQRYYADTPPLPLLLLLIRCHMLIIFAFSLILLITKTLFHYAMPCCHGSMLPLMPLLP